MKDRLVLVTGAAQGIGRATALAFAHQGARIVLTDICERPLGEALALVRATGASATAHLLDVTDAAAQQALAAELAQSWGVPDVLVNNAGVAYLGPVLDTPAAAWRRMIDINLMGVVYGCQAFLPLMQAAGGPRHILNVASLAGIAPVPNMSAYAASKFAVVGFTEVLAMELAGSEILASAVCPGIIDTPITDSPCSASIRPSQLERLQSYYRKNGAPASLVADAMVDAVRRRRGLVLVGPMARPAYYLKRLFPALLRKLSLRDAVRAGYLEPAGTGPSGNR